MTSYVRANASGPCADSDTVMMLETSDPDFPPANLVRSVRERCRELATLPRQTPTFVQPPRAVAWSFAVAAAFAMVCMLVIAHAGVHNRIAIVGFVVLYVVESRTRVHRDGDIISSEEPITFAAAVVLGPGALACVLLIRFAVGIWTSASSWASIVRYPSNLAVSGLAFLAAQLVLGVLHGPGGVAVAVAAAIVGYLVGEILVCVGFALKDSMSDLLPMIGEDVVNRKRIIQQAGFAAAALPVALAWGVEPLVAACLMMPLLVQYQTVQMELRLQRIEKRVGIDTLTGLFNRERLNEHLSAELEAVRRYGHPLGLVMGDLDNFKRVNDTLGHLSGDEVLRRCADVFQELIAGDARLLAARYGGEEFVIVATTLSHRELVELSEVLRGRVHDALHEEFGTSISLGLAYWAQGESSNEWIDRADKALYSAKMAGKNRVHEWPAGGSDAAPVRALHAA